MFDYRALSALLTIQTLSLQHQMMTLIRDNPDTSEIGQKTAQINIESIERALSAEHGYYNDETLLAYRFIEPDPATGRVRVTEHATRYLQSCCQLAQPY